MLCPSLLSLYHTAENACVLSKTNVLKQIEPEAHFCKSKILSDSHRELHT